MSVRADHVAAIRARPDCDTTRLVFADWLDEREHPLDLDRATAEFIRLTCGPNPNHAKAGLWQWCNWTRLVPNLLREHTDALIPGLHPAFVQTSAATIVAYPRLCRPRERRAYRARDPFRTVRVQLRFARGFLDAWTVRKDWRAMLEGVLAVDQPLAVPRGKGEVCA